MRDGLTWVLGVSLALVGYGGWAAEAVPAGSAPGAAPLKPASTNVAAVGSVSVPAVVPSATNVVVAAARGTESTVTVPPGSTPATNVARRAVGNVEKFVTLALECVHREYPSKIAHVLQGDGDALPPRRLNAAFYGCYDWHSAVHGHWLLARAARLYPEAPFAAKARAALEKSLTPENIAGEVRYIRGPGRSSFERPYGLAWLLQLCAELREWDDGQARIWAAVLAPLEHEVVARLQDWIPKLSRPVRSGEHSQTAFAFGLMLDWARVSADDSFRKLVEERSREFYLGDRICPIGYEPSGEDFLSPCLAEADLMRRVLEPGEYAVWLASFLPGLPQDGKGEWLDPGQVTDPSDPKLAHLDGLNLSRAWMLEGMASGLPAKDARRAGLMASARLHREAGLRNATGAHYEGGHWIGTFALYLVTGRGLPAVPAAAGPNGGLGK